MSERLTRAEVAHLAHLARLACTDEELDRYAEQLTDVLTYVAEVQAADTDGVEPTTHVVPTVNRLRPDVVTPSLPADVALSGAPDAVDGRFRVPRLLEDAPVPS